ncbi:uncharacterized protein [Malus domestica]|uniref:uncharacterized protein n=1 Tax=Malus domestica TaxID=3750 RepID=UPI003974950C
MAAELNRVENPHDIQWWEYQAFFAAVRGGDWHETKKFLDEHAGATRQKDSLGTALHNAVLMGHEKIVEELVKLMTEEELEMQSSDGWTALAYAARDNLKMVKCMVTKNKKLLGIAIEGRQMTPILIAAMYDRWDIARYLYSHLDFPLQDLVALKGAYGSQLLVFCLFAKQFDFAWMLLQCIPMLAYTRGQGRYSPLSAIASVPFAFLSGTSLKFWQSLIYKCVHIKDVDSISGFYINVDSQENEQSNQGNSTGFGLLQGLPSRLSEFFGINRIRDLKLIHCRSRQILDFMCDEIKQLTDEEMRDGLVYEAVYSAVQNGIVEVVIHLCQARPELLFRGLENGKNIFHYAVECRQENVYSLIYGVGQRKCL